MLPVLSVKNVLPYAPLARYAKRKENLRRLPLTKQELVYDVIVVGAGPSGAMAAQYAAKGGLSVALLERKQEVGIPVRCGEAVGLKGISIGIDVESKWILTTIKRMSMISPSGHRVTFPISGKDESYIINREIMDKDLVQYAIDAGVSYFSGTPVTAVRIEAKDRYTCTSLEKKFQAKCLILADGVESKCARDLGWDTALLMEDIESCAFCRVEHQAIIEDTIELYTGSEIAPGGFLWVFPRSKGKANVGLGILGTNSSAGKANELLNNFIKKTFPGADVTDLHCGGVPVGKWLRPLVKGGALIVGDAARQVNSLNGGGIAYSIYAGRIAGETVARAFRSPHILSYRYLKNYQKQWASCCGKQQMRQYALKTLLLKKNNDVFLDDIALSLLKENPEKLNYLRIFRRTFRKHPLMLLKTFFLFR